MVESTTEAPDWIKPGAKVWYRPIMGGKSYAGVVRSGPGVIGSGLPVVYLCKMSADYRAEVCDADSVCAASCDPRILSQRKTDRFQSEYLPRDSSAFREVTASPVFLFQSKRWQLVQVPEGFEVDEEGDVVPEDWDQDSEEDPVPLSWDKLHAMTEGSHDVPCAIFEWHTERVFLTREEGHRHGEAKHYNYRDGWRVYAVPAHGELVEALRDGSEYGSREVSRG